MMFPPVDCFPYCPGHWRDVKTQVLVPRRYDNNLKGINDTCVLACCPQNLATLYSFRCSDIAVPLIPTKKHASLDYALRDSAMNCTEYTCYSRELLNMVLL